MADEDFGRGVLVVGAGPVGLTAALGLARCGRAVRVIDQREGRSRHSKAVAVNARTLELMEPAGVTPRLLDAGLRVRRARLRSGTRLLATLDFARLPHRYPFMLSLPQDETERLLEEALAGHGVAVERRSRLVSLAQDEGGVDALVERGDGPSAPVTVRAGHLIGADGAHSAVRGALGLGFAGEAYPETWSTADFRMDWPFGGGEANLFMRPDGRVLFVIALPGDGRFRAVSNAGRVLERLPEGSAVGEVFWEADFHVSLRQVTSYQRGRVFLAGDAAHIHTPAGGRGMNLGIGDACDLARRLVEGGVEGYTAARHPIGARVVRESDRMVRTASLRNPVARRLRDLALRLVLGVPAAVQRRFLMRIAGLEG